MSDHIYKIVELVGTSEKGIEAAIEAGIERARQTLRNLRWFEVIETRGHIDDDKVQYYQVRMKVGFTLEP